MMPIMSTPLGLQSLVGLGLLALICSGCPTDPSSDDEAGTDTIGEDTTEAGTSTDTIADTGTDESSNCDDEALDTCLGAAAAAHATCTSACPEAVLSCDDATCVYDCDFERYLAEGDCATTHCPDGDHQELLCKMGCVGEFGACIGPSDCDLHQCQWDAGFCLPDCSGCTANVTLDFTYADSCELPMPELVHPVLLPYFIIEVGGQSLDAADEGTPCDMAELGGTIEHPLEGDVLLLCPTVCDAFADAGSLRVRVVGPC
jgi:hypothetical protein